MKQPKYSREFKADAVKRVRERGVAQIARDLDVREPVLRRWVREEKARQTDEERLAEAERAKAAAEIEKLRAELPHLLDNVNVLADRMKSLTDVVTFRDATRRLRAEIHDVFGHLPTPQVNSGAIELVPPSGTLSLHSTPPSVVEMAARGSSFASGRASAVLTVDRAGPQGASPGTQVAAIVEQRLSERPADIGAAARALSKAIEDQIELLNASRPNDHEPQTRHDDFVAFLRQIADGLDQLADSIDRAIAAGSAASPEPILLGKSAEIARKLSEVVTKGLDRNRAYIMDCSIKFSLAGAGYVFLHACGVDGYIAGFVAALMNVKWSKGGKSKK